MNRELCDGDFKDIVSTMEECGMGNWTGLR